MLAHNVIFKHQAVHEGGKFPFGQRNAATMQPERDILLYTIEQYMKESIILEGKWSIKQVHGKV